MPAASASSRTPADAPAGRSSTRCSRRSRRVRHRGAFSADRKTADGAGVILPLTPYLVPDGCGHRHDLLPRRRVARGDRGRVPRRRASRCRLARGAGRHGCARALRRRAACRRSSRPCSTRPPGVDDDEAEMRAYRARRRAERQGSRPARPLRRLVLLPHGHVQGALRRRRARALLPRSARSGARGAVRRLPPAVLDEHAAVVGARAAVSRSCATTARSTPSRGT